MINLTVGDFIYILLVLGGIALFLMVASLLPWEDIDEPPKKRRNKSGDNQSQKPYRKR